MRSITLTLFVVICMATFVIGLPCHGGGAAPVYSAPPSGGGGAPAGGAPAGGAPAGGIPAGPAEFMGPMAGLAANFMQSAKSMMGKK